MYLVTFSLNLLEVKFRLFQAANSTYNIQKFKGGQFSRFLYHMLLFLARLFFPEKNFSLLMYQAEVGGNKRKGYKTRILQLVCATASQNFTFCWMTWQWHLAIYLWLATSKFTLDVEQICIINSSFIFRYNWGGGGWQNELLFKEQCPLFNRSVLRNSHSSYHLAHLASLSQTHSFQDFFCISSEMLFSIPSTLTLQRMYWSIV